MRLLEVRELGARVVAQSIVETLRIAIINNVGRVVTVEKKRAWV